RRRACPTTPGTPTRRSRSSTRLGRHRSSGSAWPVLRQLVEEPVGTAEVGPGLPDGRAHHFAGELDAGGLQLGPRPLDVLDLEAHHRACVQWVGKNRTVASKWVVR